MTARTLVVLRHAEAAQGIGAADEDRPLTERGIRDARQVGRELASGGDVPDLVRCSTALRARQTMREVTQDLPGDRTVEHDRSIYSGDVDTLVELVRETGDEIGVLLLVGHNPTVHRLVWTLVGDAFVHGFPAGGFVVIEFPDGWSEVVPGNGKLVRFWAPAISR